MGGGGGGDGSEGRKWILGVEGTVVSRERSSALESEQVGARGQSASQASKLGRTVRVFSRYGTVWERLAVVYPTSIP